MVHRLPSRRGTVYVLVLSTAAAVTLMGLAGYHLSKNQSAESAVVGDAAKARLLALTALEIGLDRIADNRSWRTSPGDGVWVAKTAVGDGVLMLHAVDPVDDDPTSGDQDPLLLIGAAQVGDSLQRMSLKLVPTENAVNGLETVAATRTDLFNVNARVVTDGIISCDEMNPQYSHAQGGTYECRRVNTLSSTASGITVHTGMPLRTIPSADIVDTYAAMGTRFSDAVLSAGLSAGKGRVVDHVTVDPGLTMIENMQLGPNVAPDGLTPDANGIYVIDCKNSDIVELRDIRLTGTLVFVNVRTRVEFTGGYSLMPAVPGGVTVLADGPVMLSPSYPELDERVSGLSFNAGESPAERRARDTEGPATVFAFSDADLSAYDAAAHVGTNSDANDSFLTYSEGVIFSTDWIVMSGYSTPIIHRGSLLAHNDIYLQYDVYLTHDDAATASPPEHFSEWNSLALVEGSVRRMTR